MTPLETPRLRPGIPVVRRDDTHLQIGLDEPSPVVLRDSPTIRRLLAVLEQGGQVPSTAAALDGLARLDRAGLLAWGDASPVLAAAFGVDAPRRAVARRDTRVAVSGPPGLVADVRALATSVELSLVEDDGDVALLVAMSAVDRGHADELVREGRPHLPVVATALGWTVGPFVVPGLTACLRCVDATYTEHDPRRPLILEQVAGQDVPRNAVTEQLALAWAVNEIVMWVDGEQPSSWSATVDLRPSRLPERRAWRRHPQCGCTWDLLSAPALAAQRD